MFWQFTIPVLILASLMVGVMFYMDVRLAVEQNKESVFSRDRIFVAGLSQAVHNFLEDSEHTIELFADEIAENTSLNETNELTGIARRFAVNSPSFNRFSVVNLDGLVIADYYPEGSDELERSNAVGIDVTQRPYWREVVNGQRTVISPALSSLATGKPVAVIVAPIVQQGDLKAIALATIKFDRLQEIGQITLGEEDAHAIILDSAGNAIVHPNQEYVDQQTSLFNTAPARAVRTESQGIVEAYIAEDENEYSAAFKRVEDYGWMVWVRQNTNQFDTVRNMVLMRE